MHKEPNLIIPLDMSRKSHVRLITLAKALACAVEFGVPREQREARRIDMLTAARRVLQELQLIEWWPPLLPGTYELETHTAATSVILSLVHFQVEEILFNPGGSYVFQFDCPPVA